MSLAVAGLVSIANPAHAQLAPAVPDLQQNFLTDALTMQNPNGTVSTFLTFVAPDTGSPGPMLPMCISNLVVEISDSDGVTASIVNQLGCSPVFQTNVLPGWYGTCMLASGTNCANLTGGSTVTVNRDSSTYDEEVAYAILYCSNGRMSQPIPCVIPKGYVAADFRFYSYCSAQACDVYVCAGNYKVSNQ
jgi:hypothetical protein